MTYYDKLVEYCSRNWDLPDFEVQLAMKHIEFHRCGVAFANPAIVEYLSKLIADFIDDYNLDPDWFMDECNNDYDKLFWDIDIN